MYPSTLYELAGLPLDVPSNMVRAAALVETGGIRTEAAVALDVLADPGARADYDARSTQGLAFELALAWGVAALAAGDARAAHDHFDRARRIAPDHRAVPILLAAADPDAPAVAPPDEARCAAARGEILRLRNNSAFPHRLIRYAVALAGDPEEPEHAESGVMANAARELLQYDIAEAPRSYAMVLPVLREHYPVVYSLDAPFFDAAAAVLAAHAPAAEYERGKRTYLDSAPPAPTPVDVPPPLDLANLRLPPLRYSDRRLSLPVLPRPGYSWVGAVVGALMMTEGGPETMIAGAAVGFVLVYVLKWAFTKR
ncbi:MAG TPA: hypothetical protein VGM51_10865 [Armatimonadota bacterium]|jgi:hypothetical protein